MIDINITPSSPEMDGRALRGLEIAATRTLTRHTKGVWAVPSQSAKNGTRYKVNPVKGECTCPDFETRAIKCKHLWAVEYTVTRETDSDGTMRERRTVRMTYRQDWTAYNAAQTGEKARFAELLADLCSLVPQPEQTNGRPRLPLGDMVFASALKVYTRRSSRRFAGDLEEAHEDGYISHVPHFNSVTNYLRDAAMTPVLRDLIAASSLPLRAVESQFAVDSTGFSTCRFVRWFNKKYGREVDNREWVKLHLMCGTATKIVTSAEISGWSAGDAPFLLPLVRDTVERFDVAEVSADKAYSSKANHAAIGEMGITPYIMFKGNTVPVQPSLIPGEDSMWAQMYHRFALNREDFLAHYHRRSNVETVMSMIKGKFGDAVMGKDSVSQANEALAKVLCHNLCVLIHCEQTLGIAPRFTPPTLCADSQPAQELLLF